MGGGARMVAECSRPLSRSQMEAGTVTGVSGTLRRFYELLDGPDAQRSLQMLAANLRFSILFSNGPGEAQDFAGGRSEFDGYMAQRGAPEWTHHVVAESEHDGVELVLGETRVDGAPLAAFVAAVRLDRDGRIDRYIVGRSPAVLFDLEE
jgi:hypothetical protein